MKKGFTLVEILSVVAILSIIILIAVPSYLGISSSIAKKMYESKKESILLKSEVYAEENGKSVFDIKELIENGIIEPDNELGEYKDPRDDRDMTCDIINVVYTNAAYDITITENNDCLSKEELENLHGIVTLKLENTNGGGVSKLSNTDYLAFDKINVVYEIKDKYQEYKPYIEEILWYGEGEKHCLKDKLEDCSKYLIENKTGVLNTEVYFQIKININGIVIQSENSIRVLLDTEEPEVLEGSITEANDYNSNKERKVSFELTDGNGSGIKEYAITTNKNCQNVNYRASSEGIQNVYLGKGVYYICVKDKVGNVTSDKNLEKNKFDVTNVETNKPTLNLNVLSTTTGYNNLKPKVIINAKNSEGNTNGLKMCVSTTGFLKNCSWENYQSSKVINLSGEYDGKQRTVYVSIQDSYGNVINKEAKYYVYETCAQKTEFQEIKRDSCPKCGSAKIKVYYKRYDKYFSNISCGEKTETKDCNLPSCDPVAGMDPNDYESSKTVACNSSHFTRLINNYTSKFKSALDYQPFRYALYDCASTTSPILKNTSKSVYDILRNHSRTMSVYGVGKYGYKRCTEINKNEPECLGNYENYVSYPLYTKKVLVLSATSEYHWRSIPSTPYGQNINEKNNFLMGYQNKIQVYGGSGYCNSTTNGIINYDRTDCNEKDNRTSTFMPGFQVGLMTESQSSGTIRRTFATKDIHAHIFLIEDGGDPIENMNPNNYESSKSVACEPYLFQKFVMNYTSKFKTALDYQPFRDAMYDCENSVRRVLRKVPKSIFDILRNHSRTMIVSGNGQNKECTCYYNKETSGAIKTCNKPACSGEHDKFVSNNNLYNGRAIVLSATTDQYISDKIDHDGYGNYADSWTSNSGSGYEKDGETSFLFGSGENVKSVGGWGYCTRTNNAIGVLTDECDGEQASRIVAMVPGMQVGLYRYSNEEHYNNKGDSTSSSRTVNHYYNSTVYAQIFKI